MIFILKELATLQQKTQSGVDGGIGWEELRDGVY
jgi:hypothetical protein